MTFIDLVLAGKASLDDIDDWVRRWHCGESHDTLRHWLGMTVRQYDQWMKDADALPMIVWVVPPEEVSEEALAHGKEVIWRRITGVVSGGSYVRGAS